MLTGKQHQLLSYLIDYQAEKDITPSFDEMRVAIGLASKSGIHRLVSALEERGYIRKLPNRARAIEILRHPGSGPETHKAGTNVIAADFTPTNSAIVQLPLLGRIAAGTPIEALSDPSSYMDVPAGLVASGEHFALEIVGDSMVEAGIHDGDMVIIRRSDTASSGEIVVALIEDSEATLKTFRREAGRVALEPANSAYETRYFSTDKVRIQGRLTGLIRQY
ncbi:MAG: transcriptional repressor LexA [Alphaproteobacteria bacterium]|nr:transcriptional repressor LexA [Alphaproteobacteria bacterium]